MKFTETKLAGAFVIDLEKRADERGFFARTWDKQEFEKRGLATNFVQASMSYTKKRGTLRGIHYQKAPHVENKLIHVTKGKIYDCIVDLRKGSSTYKKWFGIELSGDTYQGLYIPEGFAHGFITLTDNVEVRYMMTAVYESAAQAGVRYDDPAFAISWPIPITTISKKDANFIDYDSR
jgi:dTDP-4-dehydrorhamnose 3,5-epimerase